MYRLLGEIEAAASSSARSTTLTREASRTRRRPTSTSPCRRALPAAVAGTIYLIVGLAGAQPALRAFRIDAHGVAELDLTIA